MDIKKLNRLKESFSEYVDKEVEKVQERVSIRFEKIVQMQLDAWGKRFHRHKFTATEGNCSLSFEMKPPFKCQHSMPGAFDYIPSHIAERGAIAEMLAEAEELTDLYCLNAHVNPGFSSGFTIKSA